MIDESEFGSITVNGKRYESDVYIHPSGEVEVREKSHEIKKEEIEYLLRDNPEVIVIGRGTSGVAELNAEAQAFAESLDIEVIIGNTPIVREKFNEKTVGKSVAALIHTTC